MAELWSPAYYRRLPISFKEDKILRNGNSFTGMNGKAMVCNLSVGAENMKFRFCYGLDRIGNPSWSDKTP